MYMPIFNCVCVRACVHECVRGGVVEVATIHIYICKYVCICLYLIVRVRVLVGGECCGRDQEE